jgi:hypothetical protein
LKYLKKYKLFEFSEMDPYGEDEEEGNFLPEDLEWYEYEKYIGRTVRIRSSAECYRPGDYYNPMETDGKIFKINEEYPYYIVVKWDTGSRNCYRPEFLKFV